MRSGVPTRVADLAVLVSTLLWGTLWIPVRGLHASGTDGREATTLGFLLPLALLAPFALLRGRRSLKGVRNAGAAGFWLALGIALYAEGVARGQVARVILLFYLTPVWSILLARAMLGQPITGRRLRTIGLGLSGMLVVTGAGLDTALALTTAEAMGLVGGLAWAIAMVAVPRTVVPPLFDRVFAQFLFLGPVFLLVAAIPGASSTASPLSGLPIDAGAGLWALALALLWMLPVIGLTVFAAPRVDPARFTILLMFEIVVGLTTAALFAGESLAAREIVGALFILAAIAFEAGATPRPPDVALDGGRGAPIRREAGR